jgi:hypothetical protein
MNVLTFHLKKTWGLDEYREVKVRYGDAADKVLLDGVGRQFWKEIVKRGMVSITEHEDFYTKTHDFLIQINVVEQGDEEKHQTNKIVKKTVMQTPNNKIRKVV